MIVDELKGSSLSVVSSLDHPLAVWLRELEIGNGLFPEMHLTAMISGPGGVGLTLAYKLNKAVERTNTTFQHNSAESLWVPTHLTSHDQMDYIITNNNS